MLVLSRGEDYTSTGCEIRGELRLKLQRLGSSGKPCEVGLPDDPVLFVDGLLRIDHHKTEPAVQGVILRKYL
jgi:hypothetical protein